ncbi:MAG: ATP-dependent DNA helicase RecG [Betaproteobacteria bacterium]|nr:ATP-dependent DNA helicase RecG [Betaproteobacteria bacterium]
MAKHGKAVLAALAKLGIHREFDLVLHLPLRYDDETHLYPIGSAPHGEMVLVEGKVVDNAIRYRPKRQLVCMVEDESGVLVMRFLNFYTSQVKQLAPGTRVRLFGEIRQGFFGAEMVHPKYRVVHGDAAVSDTLTPVYPTTAGLSQANLQRMVHAALAASDLSDTLPPQLLGELKLPAFRGCIGFLHHPPPAAEQTALQARSHPAWRRIKFDELLAQQLSMRIHYDRRRNASAPPLAPRGQLTRALIEQLPFELTRAQHRAIAEIRADLARPHPMQRLLQGDVGSGKTIVAALAALQAIENGHQVAIMAPTEILGEQHFNKFSGWLAALGVKVVWLAGNLARKQKRETLAGVAAGEAQITVGTHALIQDEVEFHNLGLAIVDEQHRFGVRQRLALRLKGAQSRAGAQPHQLMMSATPIPRTLAMSYYADLDVSVIDEMPPGRTPVATRLVSDARRDEVIQRVRDACIAGSQAYWVCPLIEESEALQLQTALDTYQRLLTTFPGLKIGLVHGRLAAAEKTAVMQSFQSGAIQLLVTTTVIEVGVDVPNATLMVIENAERMGLAQLHQLRGRVGRGAGKSTCILLYQTPLSQLARERLKIIFENSDGFEIARHDLRLRGPGEFLGARQSGVPMLRFADLNTDLDLLEAARNSAQQILRHQPAIAERHLQRWLGGKQHYLRV